ncbi:MAG: hypothetical protein ACKVU1_09065 [bacterium]
MIDARSDEEVERTMAHVFGSETKCRKLAHVLRSEPIEVLERLARTFYALERSERHRLRRAIAGAYARVALVALTVVEHDGAKRDIDIVFGIVMRRSLGRLLAFVAALAHALFGFLVELRRRAPSRMANAVKFSVVRFLELRRAIGPPRSLALFQSHFNKAPPARCSLRSVVFRGVHPARACRGRTSFG